MNTEPSDWKALGYRYFPLGMAMRQQWSRPVWKVSVDAGFSCPNVDGTVGNGGCIFCNIKSFSPSRRLTNAFSIEQQIDEGIRQLRRRYTKAEKFIAYFQPSTNTYDSPERLEAVYRRALEHPMIVGLAIGTRPDALPENVLDLLAKLSRETWLQLELGLQSIHRKSLAFLRRGHDETCVFEACRRVRERNLRLGLHLIVGLPDENRDDVQATARAVAAIGPDSVKLHNLYVVRDTKLESLWTGGNLPLPSLEEYAALVVDFLERLPTSVVIERISGEASPEYLLAPDWAGIKHAARNAVDREFRQRNSWQGKEYT